MDSTTLLNNEKDIVIARLLQASPELKFSIGDGSTGTYTPEDMIKNVEALNEVGKQFIESQMEFLRALKSGEIYDLLVDAAPSTLG
jgi:hypothetical protein